MERHILEVDQRWFLLPYLVISYARSIAILTGIVVYQGTSSRDHPAQSYITASSYVPMIQFHNSKWVKIRVSIFYRSQFSVVHPADAREKTTTIDDGD
jgi:hypothetical protein